MRSMRGRIDNLLREGRSRRQIARELDVDPSTVTRHARHLGYPDVKARPSATNWKAVQAYYDEGHSIAECRDRFGCSYGAWDKAVARGEIVTRARGDGQLGLRTRDLVENLLAKGMNPAEIAAELGVSKSRSRFIAEDLADGQIGVLRVDMTGLKFNGQLMTKISRCASALVDLASAGQRGLKPSTAATSFLDRPRSQLSSYWWSAAREQTGRT